MDGQLGTVLGMRVEVSPYLIDGAVAVMPETWPTISTARQKVFVIGTRPWTDAELAEHAVRTVRTGLADVLRWLGEDPGPEPQGSLAVSGWSIMRMLRDPDHALDYYRRRWVMPMGRR